MKLLTLLLCSAISPLAFAQQARLMDLPSPQTDGGIPLMQALQNRHTSRAFSTKPLPKQVLSNLLRAAFGINRPGEGKRTAPSSHNRQETDIYVALPEGLYVYVPKGHKLKLVLAEDIRALTGTQDFVKDAPVTLVFVADFARMGDSPEAAKTFASAANSGFIGQNVYLFCASEGLATGVRSSVDRERLAPKMGLRPDQKIILAQSAGYPK